MSRQRLSPVKGTRWINGYQKREHPEYVVRMMIRGYYQNWRLVSVIKVSYTTVVPTNSGVISLNMKQVRNAQFLGRYGLKIFIPEGLGKKKRGRPTKIEPEYQLRVEISGYDKEWILLRILNVWHLPEMSILDYERLEELWLFGNLNPRMIMEDSLGVPQNKSKSE